MNKTAAAAIAITLSIAAMSSAQARDTKLMLPIEAALQAPLAKEKLDGSVRFFFGSQKHPKVLTRFDSDISNLKTNAVGKSDEVACNHVFLSTLLSLQKHAKEVGANAVVNINSYFKKNAVSSETEFECHAGAVMAGVALKGDFVKIADK